MPLDSAASELCLHEVIEELRERLAMIDSEISHERGVARVGALARLLPRFPHIARAALLDIAALAIAVVLGADRRARDARLRVWPGGC